MAYTHGEPVFGTNFYGREDLVTDLIRFSDTETFFLNGIRRIGKTSVLREVERRTKAENYLSIFHDFSSRSASSMDQGKKLTQSIKQTIKEYSLPLNELDWKDLSLSECISKWADFCKEHQKKSFLLMDEAEKMREMQDSEIEKISQSISYAKGTVQVILTGTYLFYKISKTRLPLVDFQEKLQHKYIGMLKYEEAEHLVKKIKSNNPVSITTGEFNLLFNCCGGHPFLLQFFCGEFYDAQMHSLKQPINPTLNRQLDRTFWYDFDLFDDLHKKLLKYIPCVTPPDPAIIENHEIEIQELKKLGIVSYVQTNNQYSFYGEIFGEWMKKNIIDRPFKIIVNVAPNKSDTKHLDEFKLSLGALANRNLIEYWDQSLLEPFAVIQDELPDQILSADLVVHLISRNFLNTPEEDNIIYNLSIKHGKKTLHVLLEDCQYDLFPEIKERSPQPVLNMQPTPITEWTRQNDAWQQIVSHIREIISRSKFDSSAGL